MMIYDEWYQMYSLFFVQIIAYKPVLVDSELIIRHDIVEYSTTVIRHNPIPHNQYLLLLRKWIVKL